MKFRTRLKLNLKAALQGKLLLRMGAEKYFFHIIFFFLVATMLIYVDIRIDDQIKKKEENKVILANLKCIYTELSCRLTALDSVCEVEEMLKEKGSDLRVPTKRAEIIRK